MTDTRVLTVLTTLESAERAEALARGAVERRLAACAQVSSAITSVYRWQGSVRTDQEWQVSLKTATVCYPELEAYIRGAHAYDTPEIIALPVVEGGADYLDWVVSACQSHA